VLLTRTLRNWIQNNKCYRSKPGFGSSHKLLLQWFLFIYLLVLPVGAPSAKVVFSNWTGGTGNWSDSSKWNPPEVPNNVTDAYTVTIDGLSSVNLDQYATIDSLNLGVSSLLGINGWYLEFADGGTITNDGRIELKGTGEGSKLVINGEVEYSGNGTIVFDDNGSHGIIGGEAATQKLFINKRKFMYLKGATGGGKGFLGGGLVIENLGQLTLGNFKELYLTAPTEYWWVNEGKYPWKRTARSIFQGTCYRAIMVEPLSLMARCI
jgi:hypothetical protein